MKIITSLALVAALTAVGCEQQKSRLDNAPKSEHAPKEGNAAPGAAPPAALKIDRSGTVEQQLARLQDAYDRNAEAIDFLNKVYGQQKAQQQAQEAQEPAEDAMFAVNVADDIKAGQVDGPASAPVTVVKAFDFACPYCQRMSGPMEEIVKEYNGKVRVVYTNLVVHPPAKEAHLASCAAAKQGKYMQFKNSFWEKGYMPYAQSKGQDVAKLGDDNIYAIAKDVGLDVEKLKTDMKSADCESRITNDMNELQKFHVQATPTFFVNGKFIGGAIPKEQFKKIIDEKLAEAEKSGVPGDKYYDDVVLAKGEKQFRSKVDPKPN
ncbi:MAG TPA: thioredoxin domain-containing protein [Kofleriaceae bacterium]|nr:thioredoxin domain-containing protein [Kofleriaceae bacterium]